MELYGLAYRRLAEAAGSESSSRVLELGSGCGPSRAHGFDWVRSDLHSDPDTTLVNRAEQLPFRDASLDAIVMKDVWHHIHDIESFLVEAHRVLKHSGVVAVFDPFWSPLARFVYRFLHHEPWDVRASGWRSRKDDPEESNQALSYLMLRRDRDLFDAHWGEKFAVIELGRHVGPSFLMSGGVSRRTRISGALLKQLLCWEERRGSWFDGLRFFHVFSLIKT